MGLCWTSRFIVVGLGRGIALPTQVPPFPPLAVLTKEDCLRFFSQQASPTSGALLGVWRWASDLGGTCFNVDFAEECDYLGILDAFD